MRSTPRSAPIAAAGIDALVVSLGVDTYEHDPLGTFSLSRSNFSRIGERIATLGLPTVLVQEGGYAVEDLGHNVAAFLDPLTGAGSVWGTDGRRFKSSQPDRQ